MGAIIAGKCLMNITNAFDYTAYSGADMIETLARLPTDAEPAAEFRYRNPVI